MCYLFHWTTIIDKSRSYKWIHGATLASVARQRRHSPKSTQEQRWEACVCLARSWAVGLLFVGSMWDMLCNWLAGGSANDSDCRPLEIRPLLGRLLVSDYERWSNYIGNQVNWWSPSSSIEMRWACGWTRPTAKNQYYYILSIWRSQTTNK